MAPYKFATTLHSTTNRTTLVLVYAVLEWGLILCLLLNSLFSYLILKYAHYFGLKPPCLLCSRLDHILDPQNPNSSYRDLICDQHAIELSKSSYCCIHRKLLEEVVQSDHANFRCSCCEATINTYISSSEILEDTQNVNAEELHDASELNEGPHQNGTEKIGVQNVDRDGAENCRDIHMGPASDDNSEGFSFWVPNPEEDYSMLDADVDKEIEGLYANETVFPQNIEFYIDLDDYQLVPVELINSETKKKVLLADNVGTLCQDSIPTSDHGDVSHMENGETKAQDLSTKHGLELEMVDSGVTETRELSDAQEEKRKADDTAVLLHTNNVEILPYTNNDVPLTAMNGQVSDEIEFDGNIALSGNDGIDTVKISESTYMTQIVEPCVSCKEQCPSTKTTICQDSTSCSGFLENGYYEPKQTEETRNLNSLRLYDANQLENDDGIATIEELMFVLKSERNALHALHAELEEERNAASVATTQTMLMMDQLQKQKAAIEMEALQYQRMMDEQSEYDQEALLMMNEILVKREKQLQEVDKELQIYKKKVMEYEEREKFWILTQAKSRSNGEESDGLSSSESIEEENGYYEDTPIDAILNLEQSFKEERILVVEQLKVLEEKLCTLAEEEENELESDHQRLSNEEEADQMYERLRELEADRVFVKHCIGSLSKGDRGLRLLQEILQRLSDLKRIELQARSLHSMC